MHKLRRMYTHGRAWKHQRQCRSQKHMPTLTRCEWLGELGCGSQIARPIESKQSPRVRLRTSLALSMWCVRCVSGVRFRVLGFMMLSNPFPSDTLPILFKLQPDPKPSRATCCGQSMEFWWEENGSTKFENSSPDRQVHSFGLPTCPALCTVPANCPFVL